MRLRKESLIGLVFIALLIILAYGSLSVIAKDKKNVPRAQHVKEALVSVDAPALARNDKNERYAKENLKGAIKEIFFFGGSYKKADYTVIYARYAEEMNIESGIDSIINSFKDYALKYSTLENEIDGNKGIRLEGSFTKDGKNFGIKAQLIKNETSFWQIMDIYRSTKDNEELASKFMDSIKMDVKGEKKNKS